MDRLMEMISEAEGDVEELVTYADLLRDTFGDLGSVENVSVDEDALTGKFNVCGDGWKANVTIYSDTTGSVSIFSDDEKKENLASVAIEEDDLESVLGAAYGFIASGLEGD